jgi:3-hydroxybutyryl-CoA dehydratase
MLELRILHFEDLTVGMSESFSKVVSSSDVVGFAELTGDRNPIHLNQVQFESDNFCGLGWAGSVPI